MNAYFPQITHRGGPAIPLGSLLLFAAVVLGFLVAVSLPSIDHLDLVRVTVPAGRNSSNPGIPAEVVRLGIWGYCSKLATDYDFQCHHAGLKYDVILKASTNGNTQTVSSWPFLVLHVLPLLPALWAFRCSWYNDLLILGLSCPFYSFIAELATLVVFFLDIAFVQHVHEAVKHLEPRPSTSPGPVFWMLLTQVGLYILAMLNTFGQGAK